MTRDETRMTNIMEFLVLTNIIKYMSLLCENCAQKPNNVWNISDSICLKRLLLYEIALNCVHSFCIAIIAGPLLLISKINGGKTECFANRNSLLILPLLFPFLLSHHFVFPFFFICYFNLEFFIFCRLNSISNMLRHFFFHP